MMADTKVKDYPLDQIKEAPDLDALAMKLDQGRHEEASATALWLIACSLLLIRQIIDRAVDHGKIITQAFEW